ncbi:hypothetical protein [Marinimicrobium agarilyticum]|uniref:hypothetical protein n=1 Tax=Marinimicrobium agarilyticum TaxID=306546 RepID=UPI00040DD744|nr:hypothetical protein [Marinimicrobium agarilyticum]
MKASDFLKKYEREQEEHKKEEHSLQSHAKERAKHPDHLNAGTPYDWEDLEAYRKELERMEREGPGGSRGDPKKG